MASTLQLTKEQPGLATKLPDAYNSGALLVFRWLCPVNSGNSLSPAASAASEGDNWGGVAIDPRAAVASHILLVQHTTDAMCAVALSADIEQRRANDNVGVVVEAVGVTTRRKG